MQYLQVQFKYKPVTEVISDVLSALLGEIGFESFVQTDSGLDAYIPSKFFSSEQLNQLISDFPLQADITFSCSETEDKNWNEEWEKNYFQPVVIGNQLCIHSSFHHLTEEFRYRILIDPKMSFGTGHHQTTELMIRELLEMDLHGKSILDMGCGTAVLAILASMKGGGTLTAIDIDEWAYLNAMENARLNGITNIRVFQGGAELLSAPAPGGERYDVILANINRNILLQDIAAYAKVLNRGGVLVMSGFYKADMPAIGAVCEANGLTLARFSEKEQWVATAFIYYGNPVV